MAQDSSKKKQIDRIYRHCHCHLPLEATVFGHMTYLISPPSLGEHLQKVVPQDMACPNQI